MAETSRVISEPIVYPETDGQPMTESDATADYLKPQLQGARLVDGVY